MIKQRHLPSLLIPPLDHLLHCLPAQPLTLRFGSHGEHGDVEGGVLYAWTEGAGGKIIAERYELVGQPGPGTSVTPARSTHGFQDKAPAGGEKGNCSHPLRPIFESCAPPRFHPSPPYLYPRNSSACARQLVLPFGPVCAAA